ncbi:hypothetical protein ACHMZP_30820 [Rhodococcus baikonurensis]|jgi:hypothetical protein|uniref:hypothetical protein n=1 Tax=Rhodococcus baikonurensis TaxID=172041 RepID=UPI0037A5CEBD
MNRQPALVMQTFETAWTTYGTLSDSAGHLPVRDRYQRLWILVEVAGRLRGRRAFVHGTAQVNDSPDIHGLIDVDSRAVLSAHDLIDAHGPLTVEPSRSPVPVPLDFGANAAETHAAFENSLVASGSEY